MKDAILALVPDYYPSFACKAGACRTPCCEGWPVTMSMGDYFRLLGVECSPALRRKLDVALRMADRPCPEEYACISPRFDGRCPMHMDDGRCAVHAELGGGALPAVCRLYPRGVRMDDMPEASCANSCEAVVERLFAHEAPMTFVRVPMAPDLPRAAAREVFFETLGREQEIRLWLIRLLQNRGLSMPRRLMALGMRLREMEDALNRRDEAAVARLLEEGGATALPPEEPLCEAHLRFGLKAAEAMLRQMDERSDSLRDYGEAALACFGDGDDAFERYQRARAHLEATFPHWERWLEQLLVNHMFFERFPFQDRPVSLSDEFVALCAVYTLMRLLAVGWMADKNSEAQFVDAAAAAFRFIDHTSFDRYAAGVLHALDCASPERLFDLIRL